jgi:hypothetical protein
MKEKNDYFTRQYYCRICKKRHLVKLAKNILMGREKYPFSYIFLHGELKNILTTLYIDKEAQIRGVDVQELTDDDIFSKDQVITITRKLTDELESLRKENMLLYEKIKNLKKNQNYEYLENKKISKKKKGEL